MQKVEIIVLQIESFMRIHEGDNPISQSSNYFPVSSLCLNCSVILFALSVFLKVSNVETLKKKKLKLPRVSVDAETQ